ncbi:MAG TPA: IclR family transcriptional regulator C-terminal domain-containing protein [Burkholderiaceae bacterium]
MRKKPLKTSASPSSLEERSQDGHDRDFVASLHKGLEVLCAFNRQHTRMTVSEMAQRTGASPASARRSLLTLQSLGFLEGDGKHFWMAPKSLLVAQAFLSSRPMPALAQPLLDGLSERSRQSSSIAQLLDTDAIIVARSTARRSLSTGLGIGSRLPGYCSAVGRVLLGSLSDRALRSVLQSSRIEKLTAHTVVEPSQVLMRIDAARQCGFATCDEELEIGVRSMAVPVFSHDGTTVAALSISVRAERLSMGELRDEMLPLLLRAQQQLAHRLFLT